jgi:hypothetical protein
MAIFTTLALAGGAAALGAGSGALSGVLGKSGSSRQRRRVRTGINVGQQQTGRQIGALMNSPEIQAMQDFLYGLYGIDPNAPSGQRGLGSAQTLQGVSVVDPDQPSQGVKFKSLGKAGARAVQSTARSPSTTEPAGCRSPASSCPQQSRPESIRPWQPQSLATWSSPWRA